MKLETPLGVGSSAALLCLPLAERDYMNEEERELRRKRREAAITFLREFYKDEDDDLIDQYEVYTYSELLRSIKLAIATEKARIELQI